MRVQNYRHPVCSPEVVLGIVYVIFYRLFSELQTHPNLHSPVCVGSNGGRPQRVQIWVCLFVPIWPAGHEDPGVMTGHIGTNTPKFVLLAGEDGRLTLLKRGCANSGGFGAR